MKGLFWNSRGLRDLAKSRFISETTREENLDFICLQETGRNDFLSHELKHFCAGKNFIWSWSHPRGRSGGILVSVDANKFDIANISHGDFYVKFKLRNKNDNFEWVLIAVYGAAQNEHKESFLRELVHTCSSEPSPLLVGGDFNIIRSPSEKNNDRYDNRWPFLFNAVINSLDLRELQLSGHQYTWANNLPTPTFENLDRILVSTDWELKYPQVTVQALTRDVSDHTPLLLDTGESCPTAKKQMFKFELS
jgi:exonuclease III